MFANGSRTVRHGLNRRVLTTEWRDDTTGNGTAIPQNGERQWLQASRRRQWRIGEWRARQCRFQARASRGLCARRPLGVRGISQGALDVSTSTYQRRPWAPAERPNGRHMTVDKRTTVYVRPEAAVRRSGRRGEGGSRSAASTCRHYSTRWTRVSRSRTWSNMRWRWRMPSLGRPGACDGPSVEDLFSSGEAVDHGTR